MRRCFALPSCGCVALGLDEEARPSAPPPTRRSMRRHRSCRARWPPLLPGDKVQQEAVRVRGSPSFDPVASTPLVQRLLEETEEAAPGALGGRAVVDRRVRHREAVADAWVI